MALQGLRATFSYRNKIANNIFYRNKIANTFAYRKKMAKKNTRTPQKEIIDGAAGSNSNFPFKNQNCNHIILICTPKKKQILDGAAGSMSNISLENSCGSILEV